MNTQTNAKRNTALCRLYLSVAFIGVPVLAGLGAALADDISRILGISPGPTTQESGMLFGCVLGLSILCVIWFIPHRTK